MVRLVCSVVLFASAEAAGTKHQTCGSVKAMYKGQGCCGNAAKEHNFQVVPFPKSRGSKLGFGTNPCLPDKSKKKGNPGYDNIECVKNSVVEALEQAGGDVTKGVTGGMTPKAARGIITEPYFKKGLCPVNVHWHLGAEHYSKGEYDETGTFPAKGTAQHIDTPAKNLQAAKASGRLLAAGERYGYACKKYDATNPKFTTEYTWEHCTGMKVGNTYEIHWPHSALGACGSPWQYQTKFYDGVFCNFDGAGAHKSVSDFSPHVGVQSQVFTIINDEDYYYPNLMRGAIVQGDYGKDIAVYSGSTTGTSRNNTMCSPYAPITWQVDRKCHLISASSFDKMCADMKQNLDDMSGDLHAHGAREVVAKDLQANNGKEANHAQHQKR